MYSSKASGTANIPSTLAAPADGDQIGVVDGSRPFFTVIPTFTTATLTQSTPFFDRENTFTLTFETNVDLGAGAVIKIFEFEGVCTCFSRKSA